MKLRPLLEADARWSQRLRVAERPGVPRTAAAVLAHSGDSWFWGIGLLLIWALAEEPWKSWAGRLLLAVAGLAAVVLVVKFSIRRRRPEGDWGSIYRNTDPHSFPSGHAARAVMLAALAAAWGPPWLAAVLIPWSPLVALARVAMGLHYLSDILAGGALGLLAAAVAALVLG